jgi:hypothetical protein
VSSDSRSAPPSRCSTCTTCATATPPPKPMKRGPRLSASGL